MTIETIHDNQLYNEKIIFYCPYYRSNISI